MEQDKLACLESENLRLNKIISILIDQNDTLKTKIAYLEKCAATKQLYPPYLENGQAEKQLYDAYLKNESGEIQVLGRAPEIVSGSLQIKTSMDETEIGILQSFSASQEKEIGRQQLLKTMPYFIPLIPQNISRVQDSMGAGFWFRVKRKARWAMAQILIQAYNKQGCSYAELGKLTKRSVGGMAKLVASLKKRGLVERSGKSSFRLTALTLDYFSKVDFVLPPPDHKI